MHHCIREWNTSRHLPWWHFGVIYQKTETHLSEQQTFLKNLGQLVELWTTYINVLENPAPFILTADSLWPFITTIIIQHKIRIWVSICVYIHTRRKRDVFCEVVWKTKTTDKGCHFYLHSAYTVEKIWNNLNIFLEMTDPDLCFKYINY